MKSQLRMIITGAPGAGKGTISSRIQKKYTHIHYFSSGDLFRSHINRKTEIGHRIQDFLKNGLLVPDTLVLGLVIDNLRGFEKGRDSWILDGFPRTIFQAVELDKHLSEVDIPLNCIVNLDVPEDVILSRISNRWIHPGSGRTYNLKYNPPLKPGLDDLTGEPLEKRSDDDLTVFAERLKHYHKETEPLLEYYRKKGVLQNIKGTSSDELFPQIVEILDKF